MFLSDGTHVLAFLPAGTRIAGWNHRPEGGRMDIEGVIASHHRAEDGTIRYTLEDGQVVDAGRIESMDPYLPGHTIWVRPAREGIDPGLS